MEFTYIENYKIDSNLHLVVYKQRPREVEVSIRDEQNKIIACGYLLSIPTKKVDFIHSVSTIPEFRNNGYCQTIINKLVDYSNGRTIQLDTGNPIAKHVYEKCGFRVIKEGHWRSGCWVMQRGEC